MHAKHAKTPRDLDLYDLHMWTQNFIKLSATVHELSCPQIFLPHLATVKKSENPVLSP